MRCRFAGFVLSDVTRTLVADGRPVPLIPRYFDLLVLLVAERHRVVTRQEIFDSVWGDVVVSDGALSQAVRTIRRALDDDAQAPRFVRTVSRHGYQFVCAQVEIEPDEAAAIGVTPPPDVVGPGPNAPDPWAPLLAVLLREGQHAAATEEERYDAAVALHELGTEEALRRLGDRPGHESARAILRDARWDASGAGRVPLLQARGRLVAIADVIALRVRHAAALASSRWLSSTIGGGLAGALAGAAGGLALGLVPGGQLDGGAIGSLVIVGTVAGLFGACGIGGGLAAAEALARSARALALTAAGALGGWLAGALAHQALRTLLAAVFGRDVPGIAGGLDGLVLGAVIGGGYAVATRTLAQGGMAAPRGWARWRTAAIAGGLSALAGVALAASGQRLVAGSLDLVAGLFAGSQVGLAPLARWLGEDTLRPMTQTIVSAFEAFMLGAGLTYGLMRRPRVG